MVTQGQKKYVIKELKRCDNQSKHKFLPEISNCFSFLSDIPLIVAISGNPLEIHYQHVYAQSWGNIGGMNIKFVTYIQYI